MFAFEMWLWYFECSASFCILCVQFLDLCVKLWKNYEANLFLVYVMLWELCEPVIFQIWMEGHISRQRVCKSMLLCWMFFSMIVKWVFADVELPRVSDIDWPMGSTEGMSRTSSDLPVGDLSLKQTNKQHENNSVHFYDWGSVLCWSLALWPHKIAQQAQFSSFVDHLILKQDIGWDIFPF